MHNVFATLVVVSAVVSAQTTVPKGFEPFQGTWFVTSVPGQMMPPGTMAAFVVTGDRYEGFDNGKRNESGTIKLGASATPMTIDLAITEGTDAGQTQVGLVELKGDTVRLALAEPGVTIRPGAFDGPNVLTLTKLKPLAPALAGTWEGPVTLGGTPLRIVLKLTNGADGLATGGLVSPDQSPQEIPLGAVLQLGSRVRVIVPAIRATLDAELKDQQLTGQLMQGANTMPIVMKRD